MTTYEMLLAAAKQSAVDCCCRFEDFFSGRITFSESVPSGREKRFLKLPHILDIVSYGRSAVVTGTKEVLEAVKPLVESTETIRLFETPTIYLINDALRPFGAAVCFMADYWLPDIQALSAFESRCKFEIRVLTPDMFRDLYLPEWNHALSFERRELDMLAVGAFDGDDLVGLAGCSADCDSMWQIGVDVIPHYRRRGVASALTNRLAKECIDRDIVPFYCRAWSNVASGRNAIRSGFVPAWCEITAKSTEFIDKLNHKPEPDAPLTKM